MMKSSYYRESCRTRSKTEHSGKRALRMAAPINRVNQSFEEHARECTRETYENVF